MAVSVKTRRRLLGLIFWATSLGLCFSAWGLSETQQAALRAAVAYAAQHLDTNSGLVTDDTGWPNISQASAGAVAAMFALGQPADSARALLVKILQAQAPSGASAGLFPWHLAPDEKPTSEATLLALPLLAYLLRHHTDALGPEIAGRLRESLLRADRALLRLHYTPADDARFLLRASARAATAIALGKDPSPLARDVEAWLRLVAKSGLPQGHSATWDAAKYVALKWLYESLPPVHRVNVERALTLMAMDLAGRVHPQAGYLGGAINESTLQDYASATGLPQYILFTDFGQPLPAAIDPYIAAAVLPEWRAPAALRAFVGQPGMRRTQASGPVSATDTYVSPAFSLGTMSGRVSRASLPLFCTFSRAAGRPTLYFYAAPTPCSVQSVQADNLALCSFNFDGVGIKGREQAALYGVLGTPETIKAVYCYGVPWNGLPTAIGELETVALELADCYVGFTITRTGPASSEVGPLAKPAVLEWAGPEGARNLLLTIYARQQAYALPQPLFNCRAGFVIEIAPREVYASLADFVKHIEAGRLKQVVKSGKQSLKEPEKPQISGIVPKPRARGPRLYRPTAEQTIEYVLEGRTLRLVEDLATNEALLREIDGVPLSSANLWEAPFFTWKKGQKLSVLLDSLLASSKTEKE